MENIKQRLSDFAHSTTVIVMITLFLFTNNTGRMNLPGLYDSHVLLYLT